MLLSVCLPFDWAILFFVEKSLRFDWDLLVAFGRKAIWKIPMNFQSLTMSFRDQLTNEFSELMAERIVRNSEFNKGTFQEIKWN